MRSKNRKRYIKYDSLTVSVGNTKLPESTAIFNMGSATNCPSKALGICKACVNGRNRCYALQAEFMYPSVKPYRDKQGQYWRSVSAEKFAFDFLTAKAKLKKIEITHLRLNESGDFWSQDCVNKADKIAGILKGSGITVYCYTSRSDLNYSKVKHLIINGSGFIKKGIKGVFKIIKKAEIVPDGYKVCPADCSVCSRCVRGMNTCVVLH
jgi:hypothetical protein